MGSLTITYPQAPDTLNTSRIALIDQNGRLDYFAGMRWADFLPGNIQSALISSFSALGSFQSVSSDDTIDRSRLTLESEIKTFEAVYHAGDPVPEANIEIMFTLREGNNLHVKKQFTVSAKMKAEADNADAIDRAFEKAFTQIEHTAVSKIACRP